MLRIILLIFAVLPTLATAQSRDTLRALDAPDQAQPWFAVGRLDLGNGFCTGTLISPKLVLTAAHCVYARGVLRDASTITFHAGYKNGSAVASRRGARLMTHIDYVDDGLPTSTVATIAHDVAVIELAEAIDEPSVIPFERHRSPPLDARVLVVSYARGRTEVASLEEGCKMFARQGDAMQYTCDLDSGGSGSPVFTLTDAGPKIAAVMSATTEQNGVKIAYGAPLGYAVDRMVRVLETTNRDARFVKTAKPGRLPNSRTVATRSGLPQIKR